MMKLEVWGMQGCCPECERTTCAGEDIGGIDKETPACSIQEVDKALSL